jgi:hypothetical protein
MIRNLIHMVKYRARAAQGCSSISHAISPGIPASGSLPFVLHHKKQPLYRAKSRARAAPIEPEKGVSPDAAPVPDCCEAEFVVVEVLWVVVVAVLEAPEVDALPLALALAEPLDEALALPEVVEEPDLHTTWSGMVTSAVEQICLAKVTAALLPAASQSLSRQQAMPSRNSVLLQMHLMSSWAQLAIWVPVVYWTRQDFCYRRKDVMLARYPRHPLQLD